MPLPVALQSLLDPAAYPHPAPGPRLVETHISWVLLAGEFAYKLRRPVDLGFVDFRTAERRRLDCLEEVRLNRRGCAGLYLGIVPVTSAGGPARLGGCGAILDWAVQMQRLREERLLAALLEAGAVTFDLLGRLVARLVRYHAAAAGGDEIRALGGYATMCANWQRNLQEIRPFVGAALAADEFDRIGAYATQFAGDFRPLFLQREAEDRIRECHGDLRADAICLDERGPDEICLFDCLEFDPRLRCSDTGLDVAFLAMDLEQRGQREAADIVQSLYTTAAADATLPLVSAFYRCYRATIRAKVAAIRAAQPGLAPAQQAAALAEARRHFALALDYTRPNLAPALLIVLGPSGSGKSVLAGALAHRLGAALLSTDLVRKEMAGLGPARRAPEPLQTGLYAPAASDRVYAELAARAAALLAAGHAVILDGTFLTGARRAPLLALARQRGVPLTVIECQAPEAVIAGRQQQRAAQPWATSDATFAVYLEQRQRYEPPLEVPASQRIRVDTSAGLGAALAAALGFLEKRGQSPFS